VPRRTRFDTAFVQLNRDFTAATKRSFLRDVRGQLEEDEDMEAILQKWRTLPRYLAVSFDRRMNDSTFSYSYFDLVLVALDAISGGTGIYKPVNQLRVLRWNGTQQDLLNVLRYLSKLNTQIRFRRLLILPYRFPPVGRKIDTAIHRR
jgi:hypothetical protein